MTVPKVSIIVPVYNQHDYLAKCLDSILSQSLEDIEVICIDDGSTDDSLQILREYLEKDNRIRIIATPNLGYGHAVNLGFDEAKGDYIGIVEPDDTIEKDMMRFLYDRAELHNLDWIRGDTYYYYDREGTIRKLRNHVTCGRDDNYDIILDPQTDVRPHISEVRIWAGIYRRAFIADNGIRMNETPGASFQDTGFYLRCFYHAKRVMFVREPFYDWRQDNVNSSIHMDIRKMLELTDREFKLDEEYLRSGQFSDFIVASFYYHKFQAYSLLGLKLRGKEKKELFGRLREEFDCAYRGGKVDRRFFTRIEWLFFKSMMLGSWAYTAVGLFFALLREYKTNGLRYAARQFLKWMKCFFGTVW